MAAESPGQLIKRPFHIEAVQTKDGYDEMVKVLANVWSRSDGNGSGAETHPLSLNNCNYAAPGFIARGGFFYFFSRGDSCSDRLFLYK